MKNLSYRDRIIIMVVLIIMIIVMGIFLLIKPKIKTIAESQVDYIAAVSQKNEYDSMIGQIDSIDKRVKTKYDEAVKIAEKFQGEKCSYEADQFIQPVLDENNIIVSEFDVNHPQQVVAMTPYKAERYQTFYNIKMYATFSNILNSAGSTDESNNSSTGTQNNVAGSTGGGNAGTTENVEESAYENVTLETLSIEFSSSKSEIMNFLETLKAMDSSIEVNSLKFDDYQFPEDKSTGSVEISVYGAEHIEPLSDVNAAAGASTEAEKATE